MRHKHKHRTGTGKGCTLDAKTKKVASLSRSYTTVHLMGWPA
jgi:hypothetical protein